MRNPKYLILAIGVALLIILAACSPKTQPSPAAPSVPSSPQTVPTTTQPAPASVTPEQAAWNKVIEAAKKERMLTVYSYNFVGDIGIAANRAFKQKYGITIEFVTGRGAEFLERVKTEKRTGNVVADVAEGSSLHIENMKKEGLTLNVANALPVLREKDVWIADIFAMDPQDKQHYIFNFITYTPYINNQVIKPEEEPKVWQDILDPKWKGKMMVTDPTLSGGPYQFFVPLMREKIIDEEFLKNIYQQDIRFAASAPDEGGILSRKERVISIRGVDIVYSRFVAEGAPIKAIALSDSAVVSTVTATVYGSAPHPNAARLFVNWLLSPEGQTIYCKGASMPSVRKDVPNFLPKNAQISPKRLIFMTSEDNDQATKLFRERWLNKLWGR